MKAFIITSILLMMSVVTEGQQSEKKQTMGGGGFTIGYGNMDVADMNKFIPENIGKFSNQHLLIGGEGHGIIGNFIIGGSGQAMIGDLIKTDSIKYGLSGGMGTFDFGYLILNKENVKIFPMIGIGGGGYGIQISKTRSVSLNEIINNPAREINIGVGGFLIDASFTIHYIPVINYDPKKDSYGGFMTGLKIGYVYSLPTSDWKFSGGDVTGGPDFGLNMFYVKLIIGGFGYTKKQ